jgi:hypothetical protein
MRNPIRAPLAALTFLLAACGSIPVEIEESGSSFVASATAEPGQCGTASKRVAEEARYFCDARGRRASHGKTRVSKGKDGCRAELPFSCASQ